MEYNLIKDESETRKFIETVLQPLHNDEVYIVVLTARKKYCPTISSSLEVVTRDILRSNDINKIMRKFKKMGVVDGLYVDKNNDIIPVEALSLYILPEPRSMLKAYASFTESINKWNYENLVKSNTVENINLELYRRLDMKLFSAIHKSRSRSCYFIIDVDKKVESLLENILNLLKDEIENNSLKPPMTVDDLVRWITITRGGFHIILDRNEITGKFIHRLMNMKIPFVEFRKETMTPVPGTLQGGFLAKEYKAKEN